MNSQYSLKSYSVVPIPMFPETSSEQGNLVLDFLTGKSSTNQPNLISTSVIPIGTELVSYSPPVQQSSDELDVDQRQSGYFVVSGRIRVLCKSDRRQRPYSVAVLQAGDLFGADHWFVAAPLPYQAIAASDCQIVPVAYAQLAELRTQYPSLWAYWQRQMQRRIQQLFFKRYTPLQALSSKTLARLMLSRLKTFKLDAGQALKEKVMPYEGYFWVRSGALLLPGPAATTLTVGSGWSDRDAAIADGIAQVPSLIYQLRFKPWETTEVFPLLEKLDLTC